MVTEGKSGTFQIKNQKCYHQIALLRIFTNMSYWTKRRKIRAEVQQVLDSVSDGNLKLPEIVDNVKNYSFPQFKHSMPKKVSQNMSAQDDVNFFDLPVRNIFSVNVPVTAEQSIDGNGDPESAWNYDSDHYISSSDESDDEDSTNKLDDNIQQVTSELPVWATECHISHSALSRLLAIFRKVIPSLPKDPRTLLRTRNFIKPQEIAGGCFCYFEIKNGIIDNISSVNSNTITLQINIDGLPLFKSSKTELWLILGMIEKFCDRMQINRHPFIIGVYCGNKKPSDLDQYLNDFVTEAVELQTNGIILDGRHYNVKISSFVCDMPARIYSKATKGHGGYHGCDRCEQNGEYHGRVTFPETNAVMRTYESFRNQSDKEHQIGTSSLCRLELNMISQFPLDYMHLVCLGVIRKLVFIWIKGPLKTRLGPADVLRLGDNLVTIRKLVPTEFMRKPRSISEFQHWKATEFR